MESPRCKHRGLFIGLVLATEYNVQRKNRYSYGVKMRNKKGFTLPELLIVVAIIAVLVAIAIPVFSAQLHKSQDAVDMANVRSYYAQLQLDFLENGYDETKENVWGKPGLTEFQLNGETVQLKNGQMWVTGESGHTKGYNVVYGCNKGDCTLMLPEDSIRA